MSSLPTDDLLSYYQQEINHLRRRGAEFAARFPQVAAHLGAQTADSTDPHIERLIEATAFLAARVHRDLDQTSAQIATDMLEQLAPTLVQPVPAMTVVRLALDRSQGLVTSGLRVPRHSPLRLAGDSGSVGRLRTAWSATLWPLEVEGASLVESEGLRLDLVCDASLSLSELDMDRLRIHLHGPWSRVVPLYELLLSAVSGITLVGEDGQRVPLPVTAWREVGFGEDEDVLPRPAHALQAHVLLQECFALPRKFQFFDLLLPGGLPFRGTRCSLLLQLSHVSRGVGMVEAGQFQLGCVPAVNLHEGFSEPITVDHTRYEYPLIAEQHRRDRVEVHAIESVEASDPTGGSVLKLNPASMLGGGGGDRWFWSARRETRPGSDGTQMQLSLVDGRGVDAPMPSLVVTARVLCMDRGIEDLVTPGTPLVFDKALLPVQARCLYAVTRSRAPALGVEALWRLTSLLSLNPQSLLDGEGCERLRQVLRVFAADTRREHGFILGLHRLETRRVTARLPDGGGGAWRGHCEGTEIRLGFEEVAFVDGSPLMLAAVLARFFALQTSVNSFVQVAVMRGDDVWKRWGPLAGRQTWL